MGNFNRREMLLATAAVGLITPSACFARHSNETPKMTNIDYSSTAYWDDAYANGAYIPNANDFYRSWVEDAATFRDIAVGKQDIAYGPSARNKMDLFMPNGAPKGLAVFVHGGYWLETDKSMWSHLAAGAVANGWACLVPTYDLCPDVHITEITQQIASAIDLAATKVAGPICITGHSAGGHLAMRMGCHDQPLSDATTKRVKRIIGISGLYDLRPLMKTSMNDSLRISDEEAMRESPALLEPISGIEKFSWVGANERPEFVRQSRLLSNIWSGFEQSPTLLLEDGLHHFDVIASLSDKDGSLTKALLA